MEEISDGEFHRQVRSDTDDWLRMTMNRVSTMQNGFTDPVSDL